MSVVNSTVAANRALKHGGGIIVNDLGFDEAVVSLNAVTLARNVVDADGDGEGGGGGLFRESADSFEVENSLIGLNRLGSGRRNDCAGNLVFDSLGHNLVSTLRPFEAGDPTCSGFDRPTDIVGVGPRIGKPRRNGGPTKTIALRKGSPAIGKARRTTAPKRDQRGKRKDIGAYERNTRRQPDMAADNHDLPRYPLPAPGVDLAPIATLALIIVLSLVAPVSFLPLGVSLAVGIPLLVAGLGLFGWAQATLLRGGENPAPFKSTARLVTGGAFRVSRNPIYTGGTIGLFGLAVLLDTAPGLAVVVLLGLLARSVALAEERYLAAKFGDEYREYSSRVRRWI